MEETADDQPEVEENKLSRAEPPKEDAISEKTAEEEETTEKTHEEESEENASELATQDSEEQAPKKIIFNSNDSEYAVDKSITMTNFVRTGNVGYSVVEIRKGRVGDKSVDNIDSDEGPIASATVHRLSFESDESVEMAGTLKVPYWDHVPGIGPVIPEAQILAVVEYMQFWATKQQGMVGPRNINHLLCPPLNLPPPPEDEVSMY